MKLKFNLKIMLVVLAIILISSTILGIVSYIATENALQETIEERLKSQAYDWKIFLEKELENIKTQEKFLEEFNQKTNDNITIDFKEQRLEEFKDLLSRQTIGSSGYIWVINLSSHYIVSKNRLRDGEDVSEIQDQNGEFVAPLAIKKALAAKKSTDIIRYTWANLGESSPRKKAAGVVHIEELDWVIGVSGYYDEFMKDTILMNIGHIFFFSTIVIMIFSGLTMYTLTSKDK